MEVLPSQRIFDRTQPDLKLTLTPIDMHIATAENSTTDQTSLPRPNPPVGVPVVHLDTVNLIFYLSKTTRLDYSATRVENAPTPTSHSKPIKTSDNKQANPQSYLSDNLDRISPKLGSQRPRYTGNHQCSLDNDELADYECNSLWETAESSQDSMSRFDSSQNTLSSQSSCFNLTRHGADFSKRPQFESPQEEHVSMLVDIAIRTLIGGSATQATPLIKLLSDSGGPKLAEVAPALFSPDYSTVRAYLHSPEIKCSLISASS